MRFLFLLIILYLNPFYCLSQNWSFVDAKIDSLQKELQNSVRDTVYAKLLIELGTAIGNKGWNTTNQSKFALSYDSYQMAFDLLEDPKTKILFESVDQSNDLQRKYWSLLANLNFNYGHLMGATTNYKERMHFYEKALQIAKPLNDVLNIVYSNTGIAIALLQENKPDSASYRMEEAMSYPPALYNYDEYSTVAYIYGIVKFRLTQYIHAKRYFLEGLEDAKNKGSKIGLAINYMGLSKTYAKLKLRDSSYLYAKESLNLLKDIKEIQILNIDLATGYDNLYQHFQEFEQRDSAFKYLQLTQFEQKALSENKMNSLALFQQTLLKRQMQLKDLEKEKFETQTRNRMYILWVFLIVFLIFGSILYYGYYQKQKANTLLSSQKEEIQTALIQLKSTQTQLIQSEKLASLGELTAGIAHEIQNPLNFVNNFSELSVDLAKELKEEIKKPEKDWELIDDLTNDLTENQEKINHHGKRASSIVKGMLEHSRTSTGVKELTDLNALADEYLRLAYHGLRAKDSSFTADFKTDFDATLPKIEVIPQDMGRVLLNLINNAFWAVNERAKDLTTFQKLSNPEGNYTPSVRVTTQLLENQIIIKVIDNGTGMSEATKSKIFQPFFTTKPTGQGTGLGLSLAYDIVTKGHGGMLEVISTEGVGSEFIINLSIV